VPYPAACGNILDVGRIAVLVLDDAELGTERIGDACSPSDSGNVEGRRHYFAAIFRRGFGGGVDVFYGYVRDPVRRLRCSGVHVIAADHGIERLAGQDHVIHVLSHQKTFGRPTQDLVVKGLRLLWLSGHELEPHELSRKMFFRLCHWGLLFVSSTTESSWDPSSMAPTGVHRGRRSSSRT